MAVASSVELSPRYGFFDCYGCCFPRWLSLEEHGITGGLGSALEWLSEHNALSIRLKRLGVPDVFLHELGSQGFTRRQLGLDVEGLVHSFRQQLKS